MQSVEATGGPGRRTQSHNAWRDLILSRAHFRTRLLVSGEFYTRPYTV